MTTAQPQLPGLDPVEGSCFSVYDPFAEALYCRASFDAARQDADKIGCGLIVEVPSDAVCGARAIRRFRKEGDQWNVETPQATASGVASPTLCK